MLRRSHSVLAAMNTVSNLHMGVTTGMFSRTRGSAIIPAVCTCTTRCTNLIQHTRTPVAPMSHLFSILDLMAAMRSHVCLSLALLMLFTAKNVRHFFNSYCPA